MASQCSPQWRSTRHEILPVRGLFSRSSIECWLEMIRTGPIDTSHSGTASVPYTLQFRTVDGCRCHTYCVSSQPRTHKKGSGCHRWQQRLESASWYERKKVYACEYITSTAAFKGTTVGAYGSFLRIRSDSARQLIENTIHWSVAKHCRSAQRNNRSSELTNFFCSNLANTCKTRRCYVFFSCLASINFHAWRPARVKKKNKEKTNRLSGREIDGIREEKKNWIINNKRTDTRIFI